MPQIKRLLNSNVAFEAAEQKWLSKGKIYYRRKGEIAEVIGTVIKPLKIGEKLTLFKKGLPNDFEIVGINFRGHEADEADPAMRAYLLCLKGKNIEISERDRFTKTAEYYTTDLYKDIVNKCCSCSKKVFDEYRKDTEYYFDLPYAFMETIVSNVIIETSDMNERRLLLEIVDAMLGDEMDYETQTLAGVAVIEAVYFTCGYDFFLDNARLAGENVLHEASVIRDYYERSKKCTIDRKIKHK